MAQHHDDHVFEAPLYRWASRASVFLVDVPPDLSDQLDAIGHHGGFGSLRVEAQVGRMLWRTSIFPSSEGFILPVKKAVRVANRADEGDLIQVSLRLIHGDDPT